MRISPIFCQIFFSHQTHNGSFSGCVALICDCWVLHNSYHFPVSHWDGSMTYREIYVSHWLVWITYRARPQSDTVNVYNNIYISSNPQAISMAISIAVKSLNTMHHESMSVNFVRFVHTFPIPHNATWGNTQIKTIRNGFYPNPVLKGLT